MKSTSKDRIPFNSDKAIKEEIVKVSPDPETPAENQEGIRKCILDIPFQRALGVLPIKWEN